MRVSKKKFFMLGETYVACDLRRSGTSGRGSNKSRFPGVGVEAGFIEVKAKSMFNEACTSG